MHRVELKTFRHTSSLPCPPLYGFLMHRVELKNILSRIRSKSSRVPNAPCGVERTTNKRYKGLTQTEFLMHRVELKEIQHPCTSSNFPNVPNAPCGVESYSEGRFCSPLGLVPNAPCGVESRFGLDIRFGLFLKRVPNAPCGVERSSR